MELLPALEHPVTQSQALFRALLKSMSEPGEMGHISAVLNKTEASDSALFSTSWTIAQSLFDHDTTVFLSASLNTKTIKTSVQFQTDAKVTADPSLAAFAILTSEEITHDSEFNLGTLEAPHDSCTLIIQVPAIYQASELKAELPSLVLSGPGIETQRTLQIAGMTPYLLNLLQRNQALYPCGIDFIFCTPDEFLAIPRSTRVQSVTPPKENDHVRGR